MFEISQNKGFHMTFANGWTVSVQWGVGNYCANRYYSGLLGEPVPPSKTAEVAAWDSEGKWWSAGEEEVQGYMTPDEVTNFMKMISAL